MTYTPMGNRDEEKWRVGIERSGRGLQPCHVSSDSLHGPVAGISSRDKDTNRNIAVLQYHYQVPGTGVLPLFVNGTVYLVLGVLYLVLQYSSIVQQYSPVLRVQYMKHWLGSVPREFLTREGVISTMYKHIVVEL